MIGFQSTVNIHIGNITVGAQVIGVIPILSIFVHNGIGDSFVDNDFCAFLDRDHALGGSGSCHDFVVNGSKGIDAQSQLADVISSKAVVDVDLADIHCFAHDGTIVVSGKFAVGHHIYSTFGLGQQISDFVIAAVESVDHDPAGFVGSIGRTVLVDQQFGLQHSRIGQIELAVESFPLGAAGIALPQHAPFGLIGGDFGQC